MQWLFFSAFLATLALCLCGDALWFGRHRRVRDLLEALQERRLVEAHGLRVAALMRRGLAGVLRRAVDRLAPLVRGRVGPESAQRLAWAGWALACEQFSAVKLLACGTGAAGALLLGAWLLGAAGALPLGCLGALGGYLAPEACLSAALGRRREVIDRELLYFLDFLALAAEAGLSMDAAVAQVAQELPGLLSAAFAQVQAERGMGQWNEHALAGLVGRLGHRDVQTVAEALVRAGRFGSRTAGVLRDLSSTIRSQRGLAAREHANRAGAAIILPVAVFILPAILLVLAYPALTMVTGALGTAR